ncbi:hypothetical protein GQ53DRAFT_451043 [Thozetella sp. PMI_491]|nr:hypothetical protein GQ53DRAFT_451043 [Thozetella sp. PMI_491]
MDAVFCFLIKPLNIFGLLDCRLLACLVVVVAVSNLLSCGYYVAMKNEIPDCANTSRRVGWLYVEGRSGSFTSRESMNWTMAHASWTGGFGTKEFCVDIGMGSGVQGLWASELGRIKDKNHQRMERHDMPYEVVVRIRCGRSCLDRIAHQKTIYEMDGTRDMCQDLLTW